MVLLLLTPGLGLASTQTPLIGSINYSSSPLVAGQGEDLTFGLSETTATQTARSYWVEVYGVRNSSAYLISSKYVEIPPGYSTVTTSFRLSFWETGPLTTLVKVYSTSGGTQLSQRQSTNAAVVYGYWKIIVALPQNRFTKGTLTLYSSSGTVLMRAACLGLSQYHSITTMSQTNGNTPTGEYRGYLDGPYAPTHSYGPYQVINMTGISGLAETSGRGGIWIHGGDPASDPSKSYSPLRMTNGCVRISNADQLKLQAKISSMVSDYYYKTGYIYINEF
ncbi:MAG TPA: L,D-transpeptidase [Syntrophomonadaceae bacterium]|nr:L,D-transpeptidase [Syntrophomonadaceae bacterium]